MRRFAILPLIVLWALPLLAALVAVAGMATSGEAWNAFLYHPQLWGGALLALWTGSAALLAALTLAVLALIGLHRTAFWPNVPLIAGAALALPHLAFAIGFGFLIMPSGIIARLLVGGDAPPDWVTTQDPWGLSLIAVLALKEMPFLMLVLWSAIPAEEQIKAARSLGHGMGSVWLRVLLPQALAASRWPLAIVWVFGVTTVDLALVIGPTQPPTIAAVIWADLNDAAFVTNQRGASGAIALVLALAGVAALAIALSKLLRPRLRRFLVAGPSPRTAPVRAGQTVVLVVSALYGAVLLALLLLSFTPHWPWPGLIGEGLGFAAWQSLAAAPVLLSIGLALATSMTASAAVILWFETMPRRWDRPLLMLALTALVLPALTLAVGQYQLLLRAGLTGTGAGLFLVHLAPVAAYCFIVLHGPYRNFDQRYVAAGRALGGSPWRVWREVKAPQLRAPLASAMAVGISVSLVQFAPAQLAAAGRFATLPMEAVALSSGGNRALTAVFALALTLPALAAFALAMLLGRTRWR